MNLPTTKRLELSDTELEGVRRCVSLGITNWEELLELFSVPKNIGISAFAFDELLRKIEAVPRVRRLLAWKRQVTEGGSHELNAFEAQLGTAEDGATFRLEYYGTCYRRGRWRLMIEVHEGEHHHDWGCFDAADQPLRYFHDPSNALTEAEAIAAVLLADRTEKGSIKGWTRP